MAKLLDVPIDQMKLKAPEVLFKHDPRWLRTCRKRVARIPSGYTYLAQLLGHDMGHSLDANLIPHVARSDRVDERKKQRVILNDDRRRINLISNPLTLETIYGAGPRLLGHIYDPKTLLFRLDPSARISRLMQPRTPGEWAVRALYDERNRDTLMLHELTVAWMQFHNKCARRLLDQGQEPAQAYFAARMHVLRVWHDIIRDDVLPRFVHPHIAVLNKLDDAWKLDEITLQHGLFRAFHAMPLEVYRLPQSGDHPLADLLKADYAPSMAEEERWHVDWPRFFGEGQTAVPLTGLSASSAAMLAVARLDFRTAQDVGPLRMGSREIKAAVDALPPELAAQCRPAQLADDFATSFPKAPHPPDEHVLTNGPLYLALLVEAQLHGEKGGFGPLGSALFRASILEAMDRVKMPEISAPEHMLEEGEKPETMLQLIQLVRPVK